MPTKVWKATGMSAKKKNAGERMKNDRPGCRSGPPVGYVKCALEFRFPLSPEDGRVPLPAPNRRRIAFTLVLPENAP